MLINHHFKQSTCKADMQLSPPSRTIQLRRTSSSRPHLRGSIPYIIDLIGGHELTSAITWYAIGRILDMSRYANELSNS